MLTLFSSKLDACLTKSGGIQVSSIQYCFTKDDPPISAQEPLESIHIIVGTGKEDRLRSLNNSLFLLEYVDGLGKEGHYNIDDAGRGVDDARVAPIVGQQLEESGFDQRPPV